MKRIIATSAAALVVLSGAASAMGAASAYENTVKKFAPEADLTGYSDAAIAHIVSAITEGNDDTFVQTQAQVRSLLKNLN
ncbi:hypothetical protein [Cognatishimia activa]|uniref:hypothetical protein n=1 Tax=Cognatishimia activa TaxID=1715691 RepID=UPI00222FF5A6|nr:hypothetical protein [Cognatishimia activa]UZD91136.1 hypothetical protein M0D42_00540 [Cognatishimia activa]UZD91137.1 hypothetical protein M0D42_00545 [Cognatishimia activa]